MKEFKTNNYKYYRIINIFFMIIFSLLMAFAVNYIFKESENGVKEEVISQLIEVRYREGEDLLAGINYDDEKEIYKIVNSLSGKDYLSEEHFYKDKSQVWTVFKVIFISSIIYYAIAMVALKGYAKRYINSVDNFIDSLVEQNYDVVLDENGENMMAKLNMRFNKMGAAIERNVQKVRVDNENIKDALADISHQIKTPLTSLSLNNEIIIEDDNLTEAQIEFLTISNKQIDRLKWLTDSLLKISKLDSNTVDFNRQEILAYDLVAGFEEVLKNQLFLKNLRIVRTGHFETSLVVDYDWTREAILNIVKNATDHATINTDITINFIDNPSYNGIEVINVGPCIPLEEITMIFDRFYKSTTNKNKDSIGIGLNLSKKIIQAQGGTIQVYNEDNGVKFAVIFLKD